MSQTAAAIANAYERASIPMRVATGSTASTTPARIPDDREPSRLPSTTVPATANPMATALGNRTRASDVPTSPVQPCRKR